MCWKTLPEPRGTETDVTDEYTPETYRVEGQMVQLADLLFFGV